MTMRRGRRGAGRREEAAETTDFKFVSEVCLYQNGYSPEVVPVRRRLLGRGKEEERREEEEGPREDEPVKKTKKLKKCFRFPPKNCLFADFPQNSGFHYVGGSGGGGVHF